MGYRDCRYFKVINEAMERGVSEEELNRISLEALEEELAHPEIYSTWLVVHFTSTAEWLLENSCDKSLKKKLKDIVPVANKEIEIFRKYGYDRSADYMQQYLDEALRDYGYFRIKGLEKMEVVK